MPRPKTLQKIIAIAKQLQFDYLRPDSLIACGDYGCVFTTSDPNIVIKIGFQWSEFKFAQTIIEQNLDHPMLPIIEAAVDLRQTVGIPFYAIIRENLYDLQNINLAWLNETLADLEYEIDEEDTSDDVIEAALRILEARPGTLAGERIFEQIAELTSWCLERGILIGDTLASNFGQTREEQVKLRDLGGARFL